jgi:hypothetical protein
MSLATERFTIRREPGVLLVWDRVAGRQQGDPIPHGTVGAQVYVTRVVNKLNREDREDRHEQHSHRDTQ